MTVPITEAMYVLNNMMIVCGFTASWFDKNVGNLGDASSPTLNVLPLSTFNFISQLLKMEYKILRELKYNITIPTAHSFLVRFLKAAHADKRLVQLSCMILDNCLLSYNLLQYLPSQLAAAAIAIARHSVGRNIWSPTLLRYAYYNQEEIVPLARAVLVEKNQIPSELKSIDKKYSSPRYGSVAETPLISLDE